MKPAVRIVFRKLPGTRVAQVNHKTRTIDLDPRDSTVGQNLYHEFLHLWHPSWTEKEVCKQEKKGWQKLSWRKKAEFLQLLGKGEIR